MKSTHQTLTSFFSGTHKTNPLTSSLREVLFRVLILLFAFGWSADAWALDGITGSGTEGDPYQVNTWAKLQTAMAAGGYIKLTGNCTPLNPTTSSYLDVTQTVTIDLNGYTINRGLTSAIENGYVIGVKIANITLTINDSSSGKTGKITGGYNTGEGGGIYYKTGSLKINGGTITGNRAGKGGGVYVNNSQFHVSGKITINNNFTGNTQDPNNVYIDNWYSTYISGDLDPETRIGVAVGSVPKVIVNNHSNQTNSHIYNISASNFTPDNTSHVVSLDTRGYAYLGKNYIDDSPDDKTIVLEIPCHSGSEWTNVELMGKGTPNKPYRIGSVKEWEAFATIVNADGGKLDACAILTADITFTGNHQQPGEDDDFSFDNSGGQRYYRGTFDGQGHTVTLNFGATGGINGSNQTWGGLFWHVNGATIKNLKVAGVITTNNEQCGTIAQHISNSIIDNCESTVTINSSRSLTGGLIGSIFLGSTVNINNCYVHSILNNNGANNNYIAGGFIGKPHVLTLSIQNSYSAPQAISDKYSNYYSLYADDGAITKLERTYYKVPTYGGTLGQQGTDASEMTATGIVAGLNTLGSGTQNAWIAHNDTVYLATFAKYVDMQDVPYGSSPTPTIVGNSGNATVTYKYKTQGAADNTYATYTPGTTILPLGNYTIKAIVPAANGWNAWTSTMNFSVVKAEGTVTAAPTAVTTTLTYDGSDQTLLATGGTATGTFFYRIGDTGGWATTLPKATNAGSYNIYYYVTPDGNHTAIDDFGTAESPKGPIEVTIGKVPLTVTANNHSITYGDAPANNGVEYSGFVNSETSAVLSGTLAYNYNYAQYGDVGNTYTITPSGLTSSNYDISFVAGTLTVGQKEVGLTWSTPATFTYDGEEHAPTATATGLVNSDEIGVTVTGAQTNANASPYTATASALNGTKSGNYKLPAATTQNYEINAATLNAATLNSKISLSNNSFTYTGAAQAPAVTIKGMTEGTDFTVKYKKDGGSSVAEKPKDAGTYTIVIVGKGNYSGEVVTNKTFVIQEPTPEPEPEPETPKVVDSSKPMTIGGETFYELTSDIQKSIESTFKTGIALPAAADTRTTVTSEAALSFSKGTDIMMAVRNLKLSDIVTFIFTGNLYGDSSRLRLKGAAARGTRGDSALKLASGVAYEVISAGDMIVSIKLGDEESTIKSINVKASATGINAVETDNGKDLWFDLNGQRIDKPTKKGIYIKNGQKVVVNP